MIKTHIREKGRSDNMLSTPTFNNMSKTDNKRMSRRINEQNDDDGDQWWDVFIHINC